MSGVDNCPLVASEDFIHELMSSESEARLAAFYDLWRSSESLRRQIRQIVDNEIIDNASPPPGSASTEKSRDRLFKTTCSDGGNEALTDFAKIAPEVEKRLTCAYGGLSRKELLILLDRHRIGRRDPGTYLLIRAWKRHTDSSDNSPDFRLKRLTLSYIERAIIENRADFFRDTADILEFLKDGEFCENGRWDHDPGQFWQFHLLLYILEHPKEKYTIREFGAYFEREVGANEMPTAKTIRAFCRSNGISLDSTPGAPKKVST
ncbi:MULTISPECIES: hypothetical protein [Cerasicoccaceae]|uniref:hypothetical protein n=1 Tax=Cerasicoccaceae TaxID=3056374 RepID=UPI001C7339A3|nr:MULTISPECIES: hypothetical protein [Cerasicoccaceae]QYY35454.1 hypothetical protein K0V07_14295 [Ruficoccus sp. ZRK36]